MGRGHRGKSVVTGASWSFLGLATQSPFVASLQQLAIFTLDSLALATH